MEFSTAARGTEIDGTGAKSVMAFVKGSVGATRLPPKGKGRFWRKG